MSLACWNTMPELPGQVVSLGIDVTLSMTVSVLDYVQVVHIMLMLSPVADISFFLGQFAGWMEGAHREVMPLVEAASFDCWWTVAPSRASL